MGSCAKGGGRDGDQGGCLFLHHPMFTLCSKQGWGKGGVCPILPTLLPRCFIAYKQGGCTKGGVLPALCVAPVHMPPLCTDVGRAGDTRGGQEMGVGMGMGACTPFGISRACRRGGHNTHCLHVIYPCIYCIYSQIGDKKKEGQKSEFEAELGESSPVCGKDVLFGCTVLGLSCIPNAQISQSRLL